MTKQKEEFIFRSKLPDIDIPKGLPLHSYVFENFSKYPSKPCLINGADGDIYTYADVEFTARRVASGLNKLGIHQGDVIMLILPSSPEFVLAFLGASHRGAITTAANPFSTPAELAKQARASKAKLLITQACYYDKVKDYAQENDVKVVCVDSAPDECLHFSELTQADENDMPRAEFRPDDVVALLSENVSPVLSKVWALDSDFRVTASGSASLSVVSPLPPQQKAWMLILLITERKSPNQSLSSRFSTCFEEREEQKSRSL